MAPDTQDSNASSTTEIAPDSQDVSVLPNRNGFIDEEKVLSTPTSATEWNGENDPENPLLWSKWKRVYHIIPPGLISFAA